MQRPRFLLNTPTIAITEKAGQRLALYVPAGDIVAVVGGALDGTQLVAVEWKRETVMMFTIDLRKRGTLLD